jgi:cytosine/adenosine deaminase-related metal-dependent hydrolase
MTTLITSKILVPVSAAPIQNGAVLINGGKIEAVGKTSSFREGNFKRVIDLTEDIVMPGFVNAHSHLQLSAAKGKIRRGTSFVDWLRGVIAFNSSAAEEEVLKGMRDGIEEMMLTGTTSVGDISGNPLFLKAWAGTKLNVVAFAEAIAIREEDAENAENKVRGIIKSVRENMLIAGVSPHSPFTVSESLFKRLNRIAVIDRIPIMVHLSETAEEDEFVRDATGDISLLLDERGIKNGFKPRSVSPVRLLENYGVLDGIIATHLNMVNSEDIELLAKRNVVPVFCPGSSAWFGRRKVMPMAEMLKAGLSPAIGTDSLASNESLSMLDEIRSAARYFPAIEREQILAAATLNGAKALGLECGSLEKGKNADIISFKADMDGNWLDTVFNARSPNFVMIEGEEVTTNRI